MKTKQEIFDHVYIALCKQGAQSSIVDPQKGFMCLYRGPNGNKCAAGHLIPDEQYDPLFEGNLVGWAVGDNRVTNLMFELYGAENVQLIRGLQAIHDNVDGSLDVMPPEEWLPYWKDSCKKLAETKGLTVPEVV